MSVKSIASGRLGVSMPTITSVPSCLMSEMYRFMSKAVGIVDSRSRQTQRLSGSCQRIVNVSSRLKPRPRFLPVNARLGAIGLDNEEIGRELFISPETIRTHVGRVLINLRAGTARRLLSLRCGLGSTIPDEP
jgi:DNA-binding NarL/FixJ family response regulator